MVSRNEGAYRCGLRIGLCPYNHRNTSPQSGGSLHFDQMMKSFMVILSISVFLSSQRSFTDENYSRIEFRINRRPSFLNVKTDYNGFNWEKVIKHQKSAIKCKIDHPFLTVKRQVGFCKTINCRIAKSMNRFHMLFGCTNPTHVHMGRQSEGVLFYSPWLISILCTPRDGTGEEIERFYYRRSPGIYRKDFTLPVLFSIPLESKRNQ